MNKNEKNIRIRNQVNFRSIFNDKAIDKKYQALLGNG